MSTLCPLCELMTKLSGGVAVRRGRIVGRRLTMQLDSPGQLPAYRPIWHRATPRVQRRYRAR